MGMTLLQAARAGGKARWRGIKKAERSRAMSKTARARWKKPKRVSKRSTRAA